MPADAKSGNTPFQPGAAATAQGQSSAARVWAQFQDVIFERLAAVENAATALQRGALTPEIRQKAVLEAHRLAGSLGMFGLADGTRVAREIEHLLGGEGERGPEAPPRLADLAAALRRELEKGPV